MKDSNEEFKKQRFTEWQIQISKDQTTLNQAEFETLTEEESEFEDPEMNVDPVNSSLIEACLRLGKPVPLIKKKDKEKGNGEGPGLLFSSLEEAHNFFNDLAKINVKFLGINIDAQGNPTGLYHLSIGDGRLYEGNINPNQIDVLKKSFDAVMNAGEGKEKIEALANLNALINPNPTNEWRRQLRNIVEGTEGNEQNAAAGTTPTPFKKKLSPEG